YRPGETVKGTINIKTQKGCRARNLVLLAEGKESTVITVSESSNMSGSSQDTATRTYSETNVFFSRDLSESFQKSVFGNTLEDGSLEILPQNKVIPFDFTLAADNEVFSSYKGKHAKITYTVKATADIAKKLDVNKEEQFSVINSNKVVYSSNSNTTATFDEAIQSYTINADAPENEKSSSSLSPTIEAEQEKDSGKKNYEERFEKIFGKKASKITQSSRPHYFSSTGMSINFDIGTVFAKDREDFLKENSEAEIKLTDHNDAPYSAGHTVKGRVILHPSPDKEEEEQWRKKIRGMKITLNGIEYAFAQGLQRVSTIEKYDKNIELDRIENLGNNDNKTSTNTVIPFQLEIPQGVNQSYVGKYSEYFWGLDAKVNIAWSSDINARTIIEIV
ncbi:MAG: hypothetical protein M3311_03790, partial [Thermoproteota archaeon]|nr:hypothetical protein [Thermoproteota archaeon]